MATFIDFSPTALEIDEIAEAAKTINPNIPPPSLPTSNPGYNPSSAVDLANAFTSNAPDILFIAEYSIGTQDTGAILVVWENYYNATHYELFRRNYMAVDDSWQRVLIIDSVHLAQETATYQSFIKNTLGLDIKSGYYAILDADIPPDQIVEYKVVACYYPTSADFDFAVALAAQGKLNTVPMVAGETIFEFSARMFGTQDYAWMVAMLNVGAQFFGRDAATNPLSSFTQQNVVYLPTSLDYIPQMIQEAIYFFGIIPVMTHIFFLTRENTSSITKFYDDALASISTADNKFNYATFQNKLYTDYPNYKTLVTAVQNGTAYVGADVFTPTYTDTTGFSTFSDLNLMFIRLNSLFIGAVFGNDAGAALLLPKPVPKNLLPPPPPPKTLLPPSFTNSLQNILKNSPKPKTVPSPATSFGTAFGNNGGPLL